VVEIATAKLKKYKLPGSEQIPAQLNHAAGETLLSEIHKLINSIWNTEELPDLWKESITVLLYKKGDQMTAVITVGYYCYQFHTKFETSQAEWYVFK
jgi:hypothetical protein